MTKFVIGYEENTLAITDTLTDAVEYLLSLVEENAYENFLYEINYYGNDMEEYIEVMRDPDMPFYAIEMNRNNQINQIHGYCNKWLGCDPDVIPTVVRWLRKNNIKCDEKILTCKSTGYCATREYVPMPVVK